MKKKKEEKQNKLVNIDYNNLTKVDELLYELIKEREKFRQPLKTYERCMEAKNTFTLAETAKILDYEGVGRNQLCEFLRDHKIFRKGYGNNDKNNEPYQDYIKSKWFEVIMKPYTVRGIEKVYPKIMVTIKGVDKIREMFDEYFDEQ